MPVETNAKRIIKIYKGDDQIWQDTSAGYFDVKLNGAGQMAVKFDPSNPTVGHLIGALVMDLDRLHGMTITIGSVITDKKINGGVKVVSDGSDDQETLLTITDNVITAPTLAYPVQGTFFVNYGNNASDTVTIS